MLHEVASPVPNSARKFRESAEMFGLQKTIKFASGGDGTAVQVGKTGKQINDQWQRWHHHKQKQINHARLFWPLFRGRSSDSNQPSEQSGLR